MIISLVAFSLIQTLLAVWRTNTPDVLEQPDGTKISVYQSGDEHHHWLHDGDGFTIALDNNTGYWCWALLENDTLVSSGHPIHLTYPRDIGIEPHINISAEKYQEKRQRFLEPMRDDHTRTPSFGQVNNLVILIRFLGQAEFTRTFASVNNLFNAEGTGVNSLRQYYIDASYNNLFVSSPIYPLPNGNAIVSYQDTYARTYFQPYSSSNPNGYQGDYEAHQRLQALLVRAITFIANQVPDTTVLDADNDGRIDNIVFIVRGNADGWSDLLWSHRSAISAGVTINGKQAYDYNMIMENHFDGAGTIVHEYGHSLGAPDLYRYSGPNFDPVGRWCVMGGTADPPQSMCAYIKEQYMYWTFSPVITASGTYTLYPITSHYEEHAIKIPSPYSDTQYFIAEYRSRNTGLTDANLPGTGLLVYRVLTTQQNGSMFGPPDELYLYRPNGTLTNNGSVNSAYFSAPNRTQINDDTNPNSFIYANAAGTTSTQGGLDISNIGQAGESITFTVNLYNEPRNLTYSVNHAQVILNWQAPTHFTPTGYKVYRNNVYISSSLVTGLTYTDTVTQNGEYTYKVSAYFANYVSDSAFSNEVTASINDVSIEDETSEPLLTQLLANYPNPFNPSTNIGFTLQKDDAVTIEIYNIKGQVVKTLVQGVLPKGKHSIAFEAEDITSGIYFYVMKTSEYQAVRKMVLLK